MAVSEQVPVSEELENLALDALDPVIDSMISTVARLIKDAVEEEITSRYHPEFGTEWQEPDGSLYKIIKGVRAQSLQDAANAIQALHPGEIKNSVIWLRERAEQEAMGNQPSNVIPVRRRPESICPTCHVPGHNTWVAMNSWDTNSWDCENGHHWTSPSGGDNG